MPDNEVALGLGLRPGPDPAVDVEAGVPPGENAFRLAVDFSIPILTNLQAADLFVQALASKKPSDLQVKHWAEYE
jgi:methylglyoxal synthase